MSSVGPFKIETKYGNLAAALTDAKHMHLDANSNDKVDGQGLTIRGITYHGGIHMHLWSDGIWRYGSEYKTDRGETVKANDYDRRQSIYLRRKDSYKYKYGADLPSDSAQTKMIEAVELAVNAWATIMWQTGIFQRAERIDLTGKLNSASADERKASKAYADALAAKNAAAERLKEAGGPVYTCLPCGALLTSIEYGFCEGCGASAIREHK